MGDVPASPSLAVRPRQRHGAGGSSEGEVEDRRFLKEPVDSKAEKVRNSGHLDQFLCRIFILTGLLSLILVYLGGGFSKTQFRGERFALKVKDLPEVFVSESEPWDPNGGNLTAKLEAESDEKGRVINTKTITEVFPSAASMNREPDLRLIVLTMDRHIPLQRLLGSLAEADYMGDHVDLDIWIDREKGKGTHELTLKVARDFSWKFGTKRIHTRLENAGLVEQWIYTWDVKDTKEDMNEIAVILEDDLEVSPIFWKWLKNAYKTYGDLPDVGAFTLQRATLRARQVRGVATGDLRVPPNNNAYLYRLLGTWGFSPCREEWIDFRKWYEDNRAKNKKPYVPGLVTTGWYKSQEVDGVAPNMWSQWWIKYVDEKGIFTVYAQLPNKTTLASNWREPGAHYFRNKSKSVSTPDFKVYRGNSSEIYQLPTDPLRLDWDGRPI